MKNTKTPTKQLTLQAQTLRVLGDDKLAAALGGVSGGTSLTISAAKVASSACNG